MKSILICLTAMLVAPVNTAVAHTMPISYVTIVPDGSEIHLELLLNSGELAFIRELDTNGNSRIDPPEIDARAESIARRIIDSLILSVAGRRLEPTVFGLIPDLENHHFTVRAHYATDGRGHPLSLESRLTSITSGSHVTQVVLHRGERRLAARLDGNSPTVDWGPDSPAADDVQADWLGSRAASAPAVPSAAAGSAAASRPAPAPLAVALGLGLALTAGTCCFLICLRQV